MQSLDILPCQVRINGRLYRRARFVFRDGHAKLITIERHTARIIRETVNATVTGTTVRAELTEPDGTVWKIHHTPSCGSCGGAKRIRTVLESFNPWPQEVSA